MIESETVLMTVMDKDFQRFDEWGDGRIKREFRPTPVLP
jgi:hypothetical protein